MNIIKKALVLPREEYYKKHLLIINYILPVQMTVKEAEVLAAFMSLTGDIQQDPFGTSGRKIVREKVGISSGDLGNYLDQLSKKELIYEVNGKLTIVSKLIPDPQEQGYQFKLQIEHE